jgi:phosphatidylglycerol:prolipoprotein diacylglycerol transferase
MGEALAMTVPSNLVTGAAPLPPAQNPTGYWMHNLDPVALDLGFFQVRWYSLAYLAGIIIGYLYLRWLIKRPGAPMARRHADDFVFYVTLGIILGGRLGYVLFYKPMDYLNDPVGILRLWDGGMSFHGGLIGSALAVVYLCRKNGLSFLRVSDYALMCAPFGLLFGRLANFVNGELWGHPTTASYAVRFCEERDRLAQCTHWGPPRHPSQLYEAALEGVLLFLILWALFAFTRARYKPGLLAGVFLIGYGASRIAVEYFRMPDDHLAGLAAQTGLSMGQWLCIPMLLLGLYFVVTSRSRDPIIVGKGGTIEAPPPEHDYSDDAQPA